MENTLQKHKGHCITINYWMAIRWCLLLCTFPLLMRSQDKYRAIVLSVFNTSTALPFTRLLTFPVHPGIQAGMQFPLKTREHSRTFLTANASYFYHNYLAQGIGLHGEFGYEFRHKSGMALSAMAGLGYMHTFATTEEFVFRDGRYERQPDYGNARVFPSISLELGYYLKKQDPAGPKIFLKYQPWVEFPYSPGFIPVLTHVNLHVGTMIFLKQKP